MISMLRNNSVYALLAVGMMMIIITGGIDLSLASTLSVTGVITAMLMSSNKGVPIVVWVIVALLVGGFCGLINGFLVGKLKMVPMIATLGTMYAYRGLAFLISGGTWLFPHQFTKAYIGFAEKKIFGVYSIIWVAILVFIVAGIFLGYTTAGRRIYAIGTNVGSARISGIKDDNIKLMAYSLGGALAGLAGMLYTANYSICYYGMGEGYEMQAIAICILGGVSIIGGKGRVDGVVIGTLIMSIISYFISLLPGLSVWQEAIQGGIIIVAVALNIYILKTGEKRVLRERSALI
jgi:rhamnose transport system permease protein